VSNGVDLAREERLKKCDIIIEILEKIATIPNLDKVLKRNPNDDV
jgi:hypothetical protein